MFLFSDGLIEALESPKGEKSDVSGEESLVGFLKRAARKPLARLRESLDGLIVGSRPDRVFEDDIAFFALERE